MNRAKVAFWVPKEIRARLEAGLLAGQERLGAEFADCLAGWLEVITAEMPYPDRERPPWRRDPSLPRVLSRAEWGLEAAGAKGGEADLLPRAYRVGDPITVRGEEGTVSGITYRVLFEGGRFAKIDASEVGTPPLLAASIVIAPGEERAEPPAPSAEQEPGDAAADPLPEPEPAREPEPEPEPSRLDARRSALPAPERNDRMKSDLKDGDKVSVAGTGRGVVRARDEERGVYRVLLDDGRLITADEKNVFAEGSARPPAPSAQPEEDNGEEADEEPKPARKPGRPPRDKALKPESNKG